MSEIPQWAKDRVVELTIKAGAGAEFMSWHKLANTHSGNAFARYIAEHEEPPVDPLVLEMRKIASIPPWGNCAGHRAQIISSGRGDDYFEAHLILAALRRGIEIGKQS